MSSAVPLRPEPDAAPRRPRTRRSVQRKVLLPMLASMLGRGWWMMLPCLAAGSAFSLYRRFCAAADGPAFNLLLADTARLQVVFAALLVAALAV